MYSGMKYVMITEIYSINIKCSHLHQVICTLEIKRPQKYGEIEWKTTLKLCNTRAR